MHGFNSPMGKALPVVGSVFKENLIVGAAEQDLVRTRNIAGTTQSP